MKRITKYGLASAAIIIVGLLVMLQGTQADATDHALDTMELEYPEGCSELLFSDEFEEDGPLDTLKWNYEVGYVRNGEMQYYTPGDNLWCENSKLIIEARMDSMIYDNTVCPITSGSITTKGKSSWKDCYVEVKAKLPQFRGSWPAIWMMPENSLYGEWPSSGEIDILEHVGYEPQNIHFAAHSERYNHIRGIQKNFVCLAPDCTDSFHVYGLRKNKDSLSWYYDGVEKYRLEKEKEADWTSWPFDEDFYLILNLAVGGGWGGLMGVDLSALPVRYEIDYIRVFK